MNAKMPPTIKEYKNKPPDPQRTQGGRHALFDGIDACQGKPIVTVCTIVRNGEKTLEQTILSVRGQTYPAVEYIIVDGHSTDGTLDVIKRNEDKIDLWISEPDLGTSDATNKAISNASGEYIFLICADDWAKADHLSYAVETLERTGADFVFGNMNYYEGEEFEFTQLGDADYAQTIRYRMPRINFPSIVIRRSSFEAVGLINMSYDVASDYEWILRLHMSGRKGVYDPRIDVCHRLGGVSTREYRRSLEEVMSASIHYGGSVFRARQLFWYQLTRRRLRQIARAFMPRFAYQFLIRSVRSKYSLPQ